MTLYEKIMAKKAAKMEAAAKMSESTYQEAEDFGVSFKESSKEWEYDDTDSKMAADLFPSVVRIWVKQMHYDERVDFRLMIKLLTPSGKVVMAQGHDKTATGEFKDGFAVSYGVRKQLLDILDSEGELPQINIHNVRLARQINEVKSNYRIVVVEL